MNFWPRFCSSIRGKKLNYEHIYIHIAGQYSESIQDPKISSTAQIYKKTPAAYPFSHPATAYSSLLISGQTNLN